MPVHDKRLRKIYTRFRQYLIKDGFDMMQYSIYCRLCNGEDAARKHERRLLRYLPSLGSVRTLIITDRQYARMKILVGDPHPKDQADQRHQGQMLLL